MENQSELQSLRDMLRDFSEKRDWNQFHNPKNLATALAVEAAELLEPFQWLVSGIPAELGSEKMESIRFELADVLAYLIMLADKLEVDLAQALREKIALNAEKYPIEKARGSAKKYNEFDN